MDRNEQQWTAWQYNFLVSLTLYNAYYNINNVLNLVRKPHHAKKDRLQND